MTYPLAPAALGARQEPPTRFVAPGDRDVLRRIEANERDKGFHYRYSVSWAADSVELQALGALASGGDQVATQQLAAARAARDERAVNRYDMQLDAETVASLGERIARLVVIPDSVVVPVNAFFLAHRVSVIAVDSAGEVLGRVRAYDWRVRAEGVQVIADTVTGANPGRSMAEFRLMPPARD